MKKYIVPALQVVTLRTEESIAVAVRGCNGACTKDIDVNKDGTPEYYTLSGS